MSHQLNILSLSTSCTSTGKLLLASLPPHVLEATLNGWRLKQHTPHTIVRIDKLRAELSDIRKNGWAENNNESEMGVASVAAPVRNGMGEVIAAVSVAGPVQRLTGDSLRRFARPCIEAGLAISRRLGYHEKPKGR